MKNKGFVFGVTGIFVAILTFFILQKNDLPTIPKSSDDKESKATLNSTPQSQAFVRAHSPRFGNEMARVIVVEWFDPECEACRQMHPSVKRLMNEYSDRVLFVFRYMPYHKGSMFAATALEESREYGKFEDALTILFEKQPEWGDHKTPKPELIPTYLVKLGIPIEKLNQEQLIIKHGEKVRLDQEDGYDVGVQGTPSFFINEKPLFRLGESELRAAIEQELKLQKN